MKLGVFLPGRLNSQRLPNKLMLPIGDYSLWEIGVRKLASLPSKYQRTVLVSEEDTLLVEIAEKYPNVSITFRDKETMVDGDLDLIYRNISDMKATHVMWLNGCLPLLRTETIIRALTEFEVKQHSYMESVKPFRNWVYDKKGKAVNPINYKRMSTKELDEWYLDANAFRVFDKEKFLKDGHMIKEGHAVYPISEIEAIDIDTPEDYLVAKAVFERMVF